MDEWFLPSFANSYYYPPARTIRTALTPIPLVVLYGLADD